MTFSSSSVENGKTRYPPNMGGTRTEPCGRNNKVSIWTWEGVTKGGQIEG